MEKRGTSLLPTGRGSIRRVSRVMQIMVMGFSFGERGSTCRTVPKRLRSTARATADASHRTVSADCPHSCGWVVNRPLQGVGNWLSAVPLEAYHAPKPAGQRLPEDSLVKIGKSYAILPAVRRAFLGTPSTLVTETRSSRWELYMAGERELGVGQDLHQTIQCMRCCWFLQGRCRRFCHCARAP